MELEEIKNGYKNLFIKSGYVEFFMMYRALERLNNNIQSLEKTVQTENELGL